MSAHSRLGASGAHRFLNCAGSVRMIGPWHEGEGDATQYSARGNIAHDVASKCLEGQELWEFYGFETHHEGFDIILDDEDRDAIRVHLAFCNDLIAKSKCYWVEAGVDLAHLHPDLWGTLDFAALSLDGKVLHCVDYKHGAGVVVGIEGNEQLLYYAAALLLSALDAATEAIYVEDIIITIVQPRAPVQDVRSWKISKADLLKWVMDVLVPGAIATEAPDAPLVPGPWCHDHFCKVRHRCPALGSNVDDLMDMVAGDALTTTQEFSPERIGAYLDAYDILKPFFEGLNTEAFHRQCRGTKIPGRKLVAKKVNRVWRDGAEEAIGQAGNLSAGAYTEPKLRTPKQVEGLPGGKEITTKWAYKPPAGPTMARQDDARTEIIRSAIDAFEGIEE